MFEIAQCLVVNSLPLILLFSSLCSQIIQPPSLRKKHHYHLLILFIEIDFVRTTEYRLPGNPFINCNNNKNDDALDRMHSIQ